MNEKAILAKTDEQARLEVLTSFMPLIKKTIRNHLTDFSLHEDAMQEGYITILNCIRLYNPENGLSFAGYVKTAVRHCILHFAYRQKPTISLDSTCDSTDGLTLMDMLEADIDIEMDQIHKLQRISLRAALLGLNQKERELISEIYFMRTSLRSLSRSCGCHYNTIVNRRESALKALRMAMQEVL